MLTQLTADGQLTWKCGGTCQTDNIKHRDHPDVQFHNIADHPLHHRTISLGQCNACGGYAYLKVDFTPAELRASNMIGRDGKPTESWLAAHRHMELARQMEAQGKTPILHGVQASQQEQTS